jgi:hypothetical protein
VASSAMTGTSTYVRHAWPSMMSTGGSWPESRTSRRSSAITTTTPTDHLYNRRSGAQVTFGGASSGTLSCASFRGSGAPFSPRVIGQGAEAQYPPGVCTGRVTRPVPRPLGAGRWPLCDLDGRWRPRNRARARARRWKQSKERGRRNRRDLPGGRPRGSPPSRRPTPCADRATSECVESPMIELASGKYAPLVDSFAPPVTGHQQTSSRHDARSRRSPRPPGRQRVFQHRCT